MRLSDCDCKNEGWRALREFYNGKFGVREKKSLCKINYFSSYFQCDIV